jgi:hypothetical protein
MTNRRYKPTRNGKMHVESKDEYKARNAGKSPDEMDSVVMLVHLVRVRGGVTPGIVEQKNNKEGKGPEKAHSPTSQPADIDERLELESPPDGDDLGAGLDVTAEISYNE